MNTFIRRESFFKAHTTVRLRASGLNPAPRRRLFRLVSRSEFLVILAHIPALISKCQFCPFRDLSASLSCNFLPKADRMICHDRPYLPPGQPLFYLSQSFFVRILFTTSTFCLPPCSLERETQLSCVSETRVAASPIETELTL